MSIHGQDCRTRSWVSALLAEEDGKISFVTVVVVLIIILLMAFVFNSGNDVVKKIEMQNAADSVAYSAALWQARGMNAITATNHMMGELTAFYVVLEAIGGRELGNSHECTAVGELNEFINGFKDKSKIRDKSYDPSGMDAELVNEIVRTIGEGGENKKQEVFGAILDGKLTLKWWAAGCLLGKSYANYGYTPNPYYTITAAIATVVHYVLDAVMVVALKEWWSLEALGEVAQVAVPTVKPLIWDPSDPDLLDVLSAYGDAVSGATFGDSINKAVGHGNDIVNRSLRETVLNLRDKNDRHGGMEIAIYPSLDTYRLPVISEPLASKEDGERPPSLWKKSDLHVFFLNLDRFKTHISNFDGIKQLAKLAGNLDRFDVPGVSDLVKDPLQSLLKQWSMKWVGFDISGFSSNMRPDLSGMGNTEKEGKYIAGLINPENLSVDKAEDDWRQMPMRENFQGYRTNPSYEKLPEFNWKREQYSQWVRSTFPYVESYRAPIREKWFRKWQWFFLSNFSTYFTHWTNRYTITISYEIREKEENHEKNSSQHEDQSLLDKLRQFRTDLRALRQQFEGTLVDQPGNESVESTASPFATISDSSGRKGPKGLKQLVDEYRSVVEKHLPFGKQWVDDVLVHLEPKHGSGEANKLAFDPELEMSREDFQAVAISMIRIREQEELTRLLSDLADGLDKVLSFGERSPHMYVLRDMIPEEKGDETWVTNPDLADELFSVIAFVYYPPQPPPFGAAIFPNQHPNGRLAIAQAMFYNANGRDTQINPNSKSDRQPATGWDTLNWNGKAREWWRDDSSKDDKTKPFQFVTGVEPGDTAEVSLNWQAKLVPITTARVKQAVDVGLKRVEDSKPLPDGAQSLGQMAAEFGALELISH